MTRQHAPTLPATTTGLFPTPTGNLLAAAIGWLHGGLRTAWSTHQRGGNVAAAPTPTRRAVTAAPAAATSGPVDGSRATMPARLQTLQALRREADWHQNWR